jgi:hypothetical protein
MFSSSSPPPSALGTMWSLCILRTIPHLVHAATVTLRPPPFVSGLAQDDACTRLPGVSPRPGTNSRAESSCTFGCTSSAEPTRARGPAGACPAGQTLPRAVPRCRPRRVANGDFHPPYRSPFWVVSCRSLESGGANLLPLGPGRRPLPHDPAHPRRRVGPICRPASRPGEGFSRHRGGNGARARGARRAG